jgi:glycosyltransferase involved in cell wall biosynthesis
VVTTASADVPLKGLLSLVEAFARIRSELPAELVVVGSARPDARVAAAVERYRLAGTVRFTGRIPEDQLVHELRSAQVAVVPSLFEGFSLPLVEALACGTAVVATTAGALPEVAGANGDSVLLVPPGDAAGLAGAITRLLRDDRLRDRIGAAGRARVTARFTWRGAAKQTADQYRLAAGSPIPC